MKSCEDRVLAACKTSGGYLRLLGAALCVLTFVPASLGQTPSPVPFVNQPLVPTAVAPGGPDFTLTVNGTGFVSGATVNWNGSPRPTTFVGSSQLTATIAATDITTIGSASITVVNPAPGGGVSSPALLLIRFPSASVTFTQTDIGITGGVFAVATADFNGDGRADIAALKDYVISILLGNGDGTFQSPQSFSTGGYSGHSLLAGMVAADLNKDGKTDLAVTNFHSNANPDQGTFSILLGNGDGTLRMAFDYIVTGFGPSDVACADFNGDGDLDLAVVGRGGGVGQAAIFLGAGDGTFFPGNIYTAVNDYPYGLAIGDFDGDGVLDLAIPAFYGDHELSVLQGVGDGTFQQGARISGGGWSIHCSRRL